MKKVLLGNEAIVKGALSAGVDFVTGYPGCPAAEIGDEFAKISQKYPIYVEWATNEKTALESAIGANFSGLKTLVHMKSFGINVCSDVLFPLAYTGVKNSMVIVVADDPSCHSSAQSEQDSRGYSYLSHLPFLEPATPQECYDFTKLAFEVSRKFEIPIVLRTTTRVAHQKAIVEFEQAIPSEKKKGFFEKNPLRFSTMPPRVLGMKKELLNKIKNLERYFEKAKFNRVEKSSQKNKSALGIIVSGVLYLYLKEAIERWNLNLDVLKLGVFYPLPRRLVTNFLKGKKEVLVLEEIDPYLEKEIRALAQDLDLKVKIKSQRPEERIGEVTPEKVFSLLKNLLGLKEVKIPQKRILDLKLETRWPKLCQNCPYWYVFPVIKKMAGENVIFGGDIGCNMISGLPPHNLQDFLFCMGASLGVSHGISKASSQKIVAIIGDGTFFHSGIAGLVNAVYNQSKFLIIVLDNRITAMTGHQPNPGSGQLANGEKTQELKIEEIARACGVKNIKVLDPINREDFEQTFKEFLEKEELSMIVCRRICALLELKRKK